MNLRPLTFSLIKQIFLFFNFSNTKTITKTRNPLNNKYKLLEATGNVLLWECLNSHRIIWSNAKNLHDLNFKKWTIAKNSTLKGMLSIQLNMNICSCQYNQLIKHHLYHVWFQIKLAYILLNCKNEHRSAKIPHSIMYQIYQAILSPAETSEQLENKPVWKVQTSTDWFANWIKIVLLSSRLNCNRSTLNLLKREKTKEKTNF